MAKKTNKKSETLMLKNGIITGYSWLEKADNKFDSAGVYHFDVELSGKDAKSAKAAIDKAMEKNLADKEGSRMAKAPYYVDKATKTLTVRCKVKAKITLKDGTEIKRKVEIYDSNTDLVTKPLGVAAGTKVNVMTKVYGWSVASSGCGISLQPEAVQILDLVSYFTDDKDKGSIFDKVEGGFDKADAVDGELLDEDEFRAEDGSMEPPIEDDDDDDLDF